MIFLFNVIDGLSCIALGRDFGFLNKGAGKYAIFTGFFCLKIKL